ncbi:Disease resistance protein RML1B [Cardamine amara subsp. amara]|uniref:Disease resistance protein RML1B n=1 Tax=Cardamine amara subsp. amara TaxID=228776 RepID=A0ABD1BL90_CARAN
MASSSSSSLPRTWIYNVFTSFHGPDARDSFLSHLRKQFSFNGITMYDDQKMERGGTIGPALIQAINASRISIVVLTKNYASSGWCLDELLEILKCKKDIGQIVIPVFYGVDPSDVRRKTGDFGIAFYETCARKTDEEKRQKWSHALEDVGNTAGEHFQKRDNEAEKIEKIARDVSNKLNATPSRDFDGMVGLEAHLREMESLLDLDNDGVKMVGITGPAGIGKTTIARALQSRFFNRFKFIDEKEKTRFQLTCFMDNLRGSYLRGLDEPRLQEQFLSKVLNQDNISICHSGVIEERLCDQKVLIILDDVNNINQLMALANETRWFGRGSRIVVTTENKELLQQHGISNIYHVGFPSRQEAIQILCKYAFRKTSPHYGFKELAERITELCGRLPLGLRVVGSSLHNNMDKAKWEKVLKGMEINRDIKDVLRVGYDCLNESEKMLFLHIAVFLNGRDGDFVEATMHGLLPDGNLDVMDELESLENKSLIEKSRYGKEIVMHRLLQQMGQQMKEELSKHGILTKASEICDVLEYSKGTRAVSGISFDTSGIDELYISNEAFKRMPNLRFLRVYKSKDDGNDILNIPEEMDFPCRLRLLHWEAYPSKFLPLRFRPECLIELKMQNSNLEKLWDGVKEFPSLKEMDLSGSLDLKELPDLSKATNLENLYLVDCESLVELPDSYSNLQKLWCLWMNGCLKLQVIPTNWNLTSLEFVEMEGCSQLENLPCISDNIHSFFISDTAVEEVPTSITLWSHLDHLVIVGNEKLKKLPQLPMNITRLNLSYNGFESISDCCIKDLQMLSEFTISGCRKLTSLPELPPSLECLDAHDCESLETVSFSTSEIMSHQIFNDIDCALNFANCFKLDEEARRAIIQDSFYNGMAILPGTQVPAEFNHRAIGNTLSFTLPAFSSLNRVCLVISPNELTTENESTTILCRRIRKGYVVDPVEEIHCRIYACQTKHLCVFHYEWFKKYVWKVSREMVFEFSIEYKDFDIIECGAQIFTYESDEIDVSEFDTEDDEGITEGDYKSVSRKMKMASDSTNPNCGIKRQRK